ncbi:GAF domain-containing protein [Alteromonas facilis]|uniref:GAF domain-containing protein n=1 Tax=Alteromonas facilis TaxID=2048004 RepID=UPI0013DA42FB|nr:GAF domain-containing protein [Alteromonas facilis]
MNAKADKSENERLKTLQSLNVLDTPTEERFDRITKLASRLINVPTVLISLIDAERQWFKSRVGMNVDETERDISFCAHAIQQDGTMVVNNASLDARFQENPLVTGEPNIRFYAGHPLVHPNGSKLGTLCIIDKRERTLTVEEHACLSDLASIVELELLEGNASSIDDETNLSSKEGFLELGGLALKFAQHKNIPATVLFLHLGGDLDPQSTPSAYKTAVRTVGHSFKMNLRSSDIVGRYSNLGFVALFTNMNEKSVRDIAQRIVENIEQLLSAAGLLKHIELLVGIASSQQEEDINELVLKAFAHLNSDT